MCVYACACACKRDRVYVYGITFICLFKIYTRNTLDIASSHFVTQRLEITPLNIKEPHRHLDCNIWKSALVISAWTLWKYNLIPMTNIQNINCQYTSKRLKNRKRIKSDLDTLWRHGTKECFQHFKKIWIICKKLKRCTWRRYKE